MKDPYCFGGIGAVWKVLWGAMIMEAREVDDDAIFEAAGDNQFITRAGVAAQAAAWMLHGASEAFVYAGLKLLHMTFIFGEVEERQAQLI